MKTPVLLAIAMAFVLCATIWISYERTAAGDMACVTSNENCSKKCVKSAACVSRCTQYAACSLNQDLSGAEGEVLDMYTREKAMDGRLYEDVAIPEFAASRLSGEKVHSSTLTGTPTVLVFLASHCSHSYKTLPILQKLERKHGENIHLVGVYVNSTANDVKDTTQGYDPEYELWAYPDDSIGDIVGSHLVPTYLLIDEHGKLKQKLVGFKSQTEVEERLKQHFDIST